jgi:hypothetical protein
MTQVMNLIALSSKIQEAILIEQVAVAERNLRDLVGHAAWAEQERCELLEGTARVEGPLRARQD